MPSLVLNVLANALDLIAPVRCAGCGRYGLELCEACRASIDSQDSIDCFNGLRIVALGSYDGALRRLIHALKYHNQPGLGSVLGEMLMQRVSQTMRDHECSIVIPVPLHPERLRERGYNQAEILAMASGRLHEPRALVRTRATVAQAQLERPDRERNVSCAFAPGPRAGRVRGTNVILIDDVVTTGATVRACADVLKAAGAATVAAAAVAIRA